MAGDFGMFSLVPNVVASVGLAFAYKSTLSTKSIGGPFLMYLALYAGSAFLLSIVLSPFLLIFYIFGGPIFAGIGFLLHTFAVYLIAKTRS